jgi:hypothetical protein
MAKTSDSFIKTNKEYTKARSSGRGTETWREQPGRQGPGGEGHHLPDLENWTDEELLAHARALGVAGADETPTRDELERRVNERQARSR